MLLLILGHYWEVSYACVFIVLCACLRRLIHYRILFTEMYRAAVLTLETSHQIEQFSSYDNQEQNTPAKKSLESIPNAVQYISLSNCQLQNE